MPQNSNQMNLLYFYLFLCQGNIRHILYASVKTGRLQLSKGEGTKMFPPPPHTPPPAHISPSSVCLILLCMIFEMIWHKTHTNICIHICEEIEPSTGHKKILGWKTKDRNLSVSHMTAAECFNATRPTHVNLLLNRCYFQSCEIKTWDGRRVLFRTTTGKW